MANFDDFPPKVFVSLLAISLIVSALFLAYYVGGPIVRALLGPPAAYQEPSTDFTSPEMYNQAFLAQGVWIAVTFLCAGAVFGRKSARPWRLAIWAANPLTVGLGYIIYMQLYKSLHLPVRDYEYYGVRNGAFLVIVSLILFVPSFRSGAYFSKVWSRKRAT